MSQTMGRIRRILIWINVALGIFAVFYICGSYLNKSDYAKNLKLGLNFEESRAYEDAYRQFKKLSQKYPEDANVLLHYAEACYSSGKFSEMQEALIRLKKCRADSDTVEKYKKFEAQLLKEVLPDPELSTLINGMKARTYEENESLLLSYVDKKPAEPMGFYELGNLYMGQEEYIKAIDAYENVVRLKPGSVPALLNLAGAYRRIGYYSKAEYMINKVFEISPGSVQGYIVLAKIHLDTYDDVKAVEYAKKATELDPGNLDAKATLAVMSYYAGMQNDSLQILGELKKKKYYDIKTLEGVLNGKIQLRK